MNLLYGESILDYHRERIAEMKSEISNLSKNQLRNSTDSLSLIFANKYGHTPIELHDIKKEDGGEVERKLTSSPQRGVFPGEGPVYIKENQIRVRIPFDGERKLLEYKPRRSHMNPIKIDNLSYNEIIFNVNYDKNPSDINKTQKKIEREIDDKVGEIESQVDNLNSDIINLNNQLENKAKSVIDRRRDELDTKNQILDSIGVNQNDTGKRGYIKPDKKREIEIESVNDDNDSPPDILERKTFIDILDIIDDMGVNIEQSGEPVRGLDEESLRDIFLSAINSHYEGLATGETFNRGGKTDIHLRYDNNNLFIAECKFWHGKSGYFDTINQLLGNLTIRDSYASVIIFSKNKKFAEVKQKAEQAISDHENYGKKLSRYNDHDVYQFKRPSGIPVNIAVKIFDVSTL